MRVFTKLPGDGYDRPMMRTCRRKVLAAASAMVERTPLAPHLAGIGHILTFHQVCQGEELSRFSLRGSEITPTTLETVIRFYRSKDVDLVSLDEALMRLIDGHCRRFVALTFDDAYYNVLTLAYPVLHRHRAPFAIYTVANYASGTRLKWDYLTEIVVAKNDWLELTVDHGVLSFDCRSGRKPRAVNEVHEQLRRLNNPSQFHLIEAFFERYLGLNARSHEPRMLAWDELAKLAADPLVTIGAHGLNHFALASLSESEALAELSDSKTEIEHRLGRRVAHFAYPYGGKGQVGRRDFRLAATCGYASAVTTASGNLFPRHRDALHCLPRYNLNFRADNDLLAGLNSGAYQRLRHFGPQSK